MSHEAAVLFALALFQVLVFVRAISRGEDGGALLAALVSALALYLGLVSR